jgi:hypothetical protein
VWQPLRRLVSKRSALPGHGEERRHGRGRRPSRCALTCT